MERMRRRMERRGFAFGGFGPPPSGNRAFDEYRVETLKRLEEEQTEPPVCKSRRAVTPGHNRFIGRDPKIKKS
jgi:hypothetical protein